MAESNPFTALRSMFRTIPCLSAGCNCWFCNNGGLTKHMRARHLVAPQWQPARPDLSTPLLDDIPPPGDADAPLGGDAFVEDGEGFEWEHHPLLCGTLLLSILMEALSHGCSQRHHATKPVNFFHRVLHRRHLQSSLQMIGCHIAIMWILS